MKESPVIPAPASSWATAASRTYRGSSSRPPDWVAPLAVSEPLWSDELGRILYDAAMRRGRQPPESCQLRLVGPENPEMLLGRPARSDPPPARPIGELPDGDRDGFGQPW